MEASGEAGRRPCRPLPRPKAGTPFLQPLPEKDEVALKQLRELTSWKPQAEVTKTPEEKSP